jgi:hypothetical protein
MHAVSAGGHRNIGPVVNHAQDAACLTRPDELDGQSEKLIVLNVFCPQLDAIGASGYAAMR